MVAPILKAMYFGKEVKVDKLEELKSKIMVLDQQLTGKSFLVGETLTIADVVMATSLSECFQTIFNEKFRK